MKTVTIRQSIKVPAPPKAVYEAYVNAKKHAKFTGGGAVKFGKQIGSGMSAFAGYVKGKILELRPGRHIRQTWWTKGWPKGASPSELLLLLKREGNGTRLTMMHSLVPSSAAKHLRSGWHKSYWKPLKAYFTKK